VIRARASWRGKGGHTASRLYALLCEK
jgi:hypothetical protein